MENLQWVQELQQPQQSRPQQPQQQYRRKPLEKMVGALLLDRVFRESFISNPTSRPDAVACYSQSYLRRFGEPLIELTPAEEALIASILTDSIQRFCEVLDRELEEDEARALSEKYISPKFRLTSADSKQSEHSTAA